MTFSESISSPPFHLQVSEISLFVEESIARIFTQWMSRYLSDSPPLTYP
jgi:hypothetical protein